MFRVVIPLLYTSKTLSFIGINVINFLERFKDMATDYGLSDDRKVQRVQKYYKFGIVQRIQDLDSYEEKDWKGLMKKMKAIYKDGDINQQRYTRAYLTILAYKARGEKKIDLYNRQFRSIAKELIKKNNLTKIVRFDYILVNCLDILHESCCLIRNLNLIITTAALI